MMNTTSRNTNNDVNGIVSPANSVTPGRLFVENQAESGRNPATGDKQNINPEKTQGRRKWMRNDNIRLMNCYFLAESDPKMGYIKRIL